VSGEEDKIAKKQIIPRKNRIAKKKKAVVTVGEDKDRAQTLTSNQPHLAPRRGPSVRGPPDTAIYISAPQVCDRYGGVSHMWLERMLKRDPTFPRPSKFGRLRFFKIDELIAWERAAAAKSRAA
jgi:predicted DNA-binding transcriptional regulator AlpA